MNCGEWPREEVIYIKKTIGLIFAISAIVSLAFIAVFSMTISRETDQRVLARGGKYGECATIQDGTLLTSDGEVIETGFDQWGYNYQASMFSGGYCDAYRDAAWCQSYKEVNLIMKWNDAWLSNKDCDEDGLLDRHYGFNSYIGSGAWLTNHQSGSYIGDDGKEHNWVYFVKIVAVPSDAVLTDGTWHTADGEEIGPEIWGEFATIESIYNDPYEGYTGKEYLSPSGPGFGKWK
jgi:hypothetical protein